MSQEDRSQHNRLQVEYFEKRADVFQQTIPEDIQQRSEYIVKSACIEQESRILDVGTGTGVLIGHFLANGARQCNIVGCDLSPRMLSLAATHYDRVFFWLGDVMDLSLSALPPKFPSHLAGFDLIFFNACFANMHDRRAVLQHSRELLMPGGRVVVSHPAPSFVSWLHESDPDIVPHLLPSKDEAEAWSKDLGFTLKHYETNEVLYLAIFARA
jgi:SAM-dependent methyltransferase